MFLVVSDKMCIFCLYPILDSQQCVKRGSYRRPILSELFVSFQFLLDPRPVYVKVWVWASNLFRYVIYLFYWVFESFRIEFCFVLIFIFISNFYLCLNVVSSYGVVSYRAMFFVLILFYIKCRSILINCLVISCVFVIKCLLC